jgi:hypothetical protein
MEKGLLGERKNNEHRFEVASQSSVTVTCCTTIVRARSNIHHRQHKEAVGAEGRWGG